MFVFKNPMSFVCSEYNYLCLIYSADQQFIITSMFVIIVILLDAVPYKNALSSWAIMLQNNSGFADSIVPSWEIRKFKQSLPVMYSIVIGATFLIGLLHFFVSYEDLPGHIFRKIFLVICYELQLYGVYDIIIEIKLIAMALRALERALKKSLSQKRSTNVKLCNILIKYQQLLTNVSLTLHCVMIYLTPILIIWGSISVFSLISNIYIWFKFDSYSYSALGLLQFRTVFIIVVIFVVLIMIEDLINRKVRIVIILYKLYYSTCIIV